MRLCPVPDLDHWIGRTVEIVATGERGRVVGVPIAAEQSITLSVRIGTHICNCDRCDYGGKLVHVTVRDGVESGVRVVAE